MAIERATTNITKFLQMSIKKRGFASFDELLKCIRRFSIFSTKRISGASAAKLTIHFCEKRDANFSYDTSQAFDTYESTVTVKRSSIYKEYYPSHFRHLSRIAQLTREK